jgi:hypothetical protein
MLHISRLSLGLFGALIALPLSAASVSLMPAEAEVSGQFTVNLTLNAPGVAGNHPGVFQGLVIVDYDPSLVSFDGFEYLNPAVQYLAPPAIGGDALLQTVLVGFDDALDVGTIGAFSFTALAPAGTTILFGIGDGDDFFGSFINTSPSNQQFFPDFNGAAVTVVPIPAAAWLFLSALGLLGGIRRRRNVSDRPG